MADDDFTDITDDVSKNWTYVQEMERQHGTGVF